MHKYSLKWWKAQYRQFNSDEFLVALPRMQREMQIKWRILKKDRSNEVQVEGISPVYFVITAVIVTLTMSYFLVLSNPVEQFKFNSYIYENIYICPGMSLFKIPSDANAVPVSIMAVIWIGFKAGIEIPFWVKVYYYRKYRKQKLEEGAREID